MSVVIFLKGGKKIADLSLFHFHILLKKRLYLKTLSDKIDNSQQKSGYM